MSSVKIKNSILKGELTVPPSKSAAHRAMICSFLAGGGNVSPIIESNDMAAMQQVIAAFKNDGKNVNCLESGNTLRFMIPIAAALSKHCVFTGSGRLPERPITEYLRLLPQHGVKCISQNGKIPLEIQGTLTSGDFEMPGNISSQYITGLMFALPLLKEDSRIILTTQLESKPYVDMTIGVLSDYGVEVQQKEYGYFIKGNQKYKKRDYTVESDWSQAAFFLAAGAIGSDIILKGLNPYSTQGDKKIVDIIKRFGADIEFKDGILHCRKNRLKGIDINVSDIPDTVPSIAIVAAFADGITTIRGGERLRLKESDRISSVVTNLKKMGALAEETRDGMIIKGSSLHGAHIDSFNDHRIAMAFSIAALYACGETMISDALCINKTYPSFYDDYNMLGGKANVISDM